MSLLVLALPGTALAQDDGVTVDPDSPTAKEYAIPLDSARREAAPATRSTATPLFGEGVTPDPEENSTGSAAGQEDDGNGSTGDGRSGSTPAKRSTPASGESAQDQPVLDVVAQAASRPGAPSDGGATMLVAGGGIALVAAAAGAGFMARRRRDPGT